MLKIFALLVHDSQELCQSMRLGFHVELWAPLQYLLAANSSSELSVSLLLSLSLSLSSAQPIHSLTHSLTPSISKADGTSAYLKGTKKVWTLRPPADHPFPGTITITQYPGDVIYLPPGWWHGVRLAPFLPPMPSFPNGVGGRAGPHLRRTRTNQKILRKKSEICVPHTGGGKFN